MSSKRKRGLWVADFETTADEDDCRVWAWCATDVRTVFDNENTLYGNDIASFL